jgi:PAS domain S-box-containing protein
LHSPELNFIGEDGSSLLPEDYPSMRALITGKPVRDFTLGFYNPMQGDYVWMNVNAIPRFNKGEPLPHEVIVTLHDISESRRVQTELLTREQQINVLLKEAQQARKTLLSILEDDHEINASLLQSEERYRSVVETATDAIITFDSDGRIVLWNRAATHIFGYDSREIVGAQFSKLFDNALRDEDVRSLFIAVTAGVFTTPMTVNEVSGLKKNGTGFPAEIAFGIVSQDYS